MTLTYPSISVRDALTKELTAIATAEAKISGISIPADPKAILKMAIPLDSLAVVDVLCSIEPIIGFPLHETIVETGGYPSIDDALTKILPKIEKAWKKHHGVFA